jgi:hypothetical protein
MYSCLYDFTPQMDAGASDHAHGAPLALDRARSLTLASHALKDPLFLRIELLLREHTGVEQTLQFGQLVHALVGGGASRRRIGRRRRFLLSLGLLGRSVLGGLFRCSVRTCLARGVRDSAYSCGTHQGPSS